MLLLQLLLVGLLPDDVVVHLEETAKELLLEHPREVELFVVFLFGEFLPWRLCAPDYSLL